MASSTVGMSLLMSCRCRASVAVETRTRCSAAALCSAAGTR